MIKRLERPKSERLKAITDYFEGLSSDLQKNTYIDRHLTVSLASIYYFFEDRPTNHDVQIKFHTLEEFFHLPTEQRNNWKNSVYLKYLTLKIVFLRMFFSDS